MLNVIQRMALWLIFPLVAAVCFGRLIASPHALIADADRPMIDHAIPGQPRGVGNDLTAVFLPRFLALTARGNGGVPLRNPSWDASGFGGRPLVGNPQSGLFYPPVWLAYLSGRPESLGWLTVAHLIGAGVGVYVLTRSLGFGRFAAGVAGGCFEAAPYLLAHTFEGHYPHVWSACWYPWAFWALGRAMKGKVDGALVLPAVLALTYLTGHPQEWYYLVLVISAWVLADAVALARSGPLSKSVTPLLAWGGMLGLSLGLCALALVPEFMAHPWLLKSSVIPIRMVNRYQLHLVNLVQLVHPFALGRPDRYFGYDNYWETLLSVGLAPLVLGLVGFAWHPDRRVVVRWGVLVVVSVVFAAGRRLLLYPVAYALVPGMDRFRVPSRSLFLASLGAAVLAGAGIDVLIGRALRVEDWGKVRARLRVSLLTLGVSVVLLACLAPRDRPRFRSSRPGIETLSQTRPDRVAKKAEERLRWPLAARVTVENGIFWMTWFGILASVSFPVRREHGAVVAAWGLGGVALLELGLYARSLLVCAPASLFLAGGADLDGLSSVKGERTGPERVASVGTTLTDLRAAIDGLEKTNVNDGFQIQHAAEVYETLYPYLEGTPRRRPEERPMDCAVEARQQAVARVVLDLMSVRYLVSEREIRLPEMERLHDGPTHRYRNPSALPRAYVVPRGKVNSFGSRSVAARLLNLDPHFEVLVERDPLRGMGRQTFKPAEWRSDDPDRIEIRVETDAPGLLVVGNTWMPGWSSTVDGKPVPVVRGNVWQQVIPIREAGPHEIILRYQPPGLATGLIVSYGAMVGWGGLGLFVLARPFLARWKPRPERGYDAVPLMA